MYSRPRSDDDKSTTPHGNPFIGARIMFEYQRPAIPMLKTILFALILALWSLVTASAQDAEEISTLTPIQSSGKIKIPKKPIISENGIAAELRVTTVHPANNGSLVEIVFKTDCRELLFVNVGGEELARLQFNFLIRSADGTVNGFIEGRQNHVVATRALLNLGECPAGTIRRLVTLPKGQYRLAATLRDTEQNARNVTSIGFAVD